MQAPLGTAPGVPARLLLGEGAVDVPAFPMARVGDLVDVVLTGPDGGCAVTQRARVVSSSETILTVAVPASEIPSIEAAANQRVYLRNGLDGVEAAPRHALGGPRPGLR